MQDNGIGIPPEAIERIFLPFEQGRLRRITVSAGSGWAWRFPQAIVDLHGGTIEAESAGEGQGATFRVQLPGAQTFA